MKGPFRIVILSVLSVIFAGCSELAVIKTNPAGAEIYCNGQRVGQSPCKVPLPESEDGMIGMNVIEARKDGYLPEYYYLSGRPSDQTAGHIQSYSLTSPVIMIELTKMPDGMSSEKVPEALKVDSPSMTAGLGAFENKACIEIRLVRVKDGRVLCQASRCEAVENVTFIAQSLVSELCEYLPPQDDKPEIRVMTLRNRRGSDFGKKLRDDLTEELMRETCFSGGYPKVQTLDLRGVISEDKLDSQATFVRIKKKGLLHGVDYLLMGGVAESIKP